MLVELAVDHGERVKQGTVLARLDSAEQQVRVTKAQANLTQAEAALQKDEATLERSRAILKQRQQTNRRQQALVKQKAAYPPHTLINNTKSKSTDILPLS